MNELVAPEEIFQACLFGRVDEVERALPRMQESLGGTAWKFAIRAALRHAVPARNTLAAPEVDPGPETALPLALGWAEVARYSVLCFDRQASEEAIEQAQRAAAFMSEVPAAVEFATGLVEVIFGPTAETDARLERASLLARKTSDPATVIGAAATRALLWAERDVQSALTRARQASRMSRTEALPQMEYLANTVLARCRRLHGYPHLSVRILSSLLRFAPDQWGGWLSWELLMAGDPETAKEAANRMRRAAPECPALLAADAALHAASDVGSAVDSGFSRLLESASIAPLLHWDAHTLATTVDPEGPSPTEASEVASWCRGEQAAVPRGLHGLAAVLGAGSLKDSVARVLVRPPCDGRRFLAIGQSLNGSPAVSLKQSDRRQGRTDTLIAVLALAGQQGLEDHELFQQVYGFAYDPEIHEGSFRMLRTRVDEWLGSRGSLVRESRRFSLQVHGSLNVADPRSVPPVSVRITQILARKGAATAKQTAQLLKVPIRTAQGALQELLSDGACERVRVGNRVEYRIEDTTFSEPTCV